MLNAEKIGLLEEVMDLEKGTLTEDSILSDFEEWDSLSKLSLIAMARKEFNKVINANEIKSFNTVKDICKYLEA